MSAGAASVVFRADASWTMGNGHVMRCLTLADALRAQGWQTLFLCRAHDGHLGERITARGHDLRLLPPAPPENGDLAHAAWLGGTWQQDAEATRAALAGQGADWLVVDHYALDARWENALRPVAARIMAIDDLADRPHDVDLLLDQNLGRVPADYDGLLPAGAMRLVGPPHALLRPEFAAARATALARRAAVDWRLETVLVAMGGTDSDNTTGAVLRALAGATGLGDLRVRVGLGSNAPHLDSVREQVAALGDRFDLLVDRSDMAALMAWADVAIGGVGGTSWERCTLGLPALLLVLADNQRPGALALDRAGAAALCGDARQKGWQDKVIAVLKDTERLQAMSRAAQSVCDGSGVARVIQAMQRIATTAPIVTLRAATMQDALPVLQWRQAMDTRFLASGAMPDKDAHLAWFRRSLDLAGRHLFIAETADTPSIGHLRLDAGACGHWIVSIVLNPAFRGRGFAVPALQALAAHARGLGASVLDAEIHRENIASQRAFGRAGFSPGTSRPPFDCWTLVLRGR